MRTECDYLFDWIKKKKVKYANISPNMVIAGNAEEEKKRHSIRHCYPDTHSHMDKLCP